jgi:hypothetical protein
MLIERVEDIVSMLFAHILNPEVIDDQSEHDGVCLVLPRVVSVAYWVVAIWSQAFYHYVICKSDCVGLV